MSMTETWTHSRRLIDLATFRPADVDLDEIAHALAYINRYCGHTSRPYSVAEHSIIGAWWALWKGDLHLALAFLIHDAHEAYLGDIATPVKALINVKPLETRMEWAVQDALRVNIRSDVRLKGAVKTLDRLMASAELHTLMGADWALTMADHEDAEPIIKHLLDPIPPHLLSSTWLQTYRTLQAERVAEVHASDAAEVRA